MAPKKNNKSKKVEKAVDYASPASKRKFTMNSKAVFRKGLNMMLAVNAIVDSPEGSDYTQYQKMVIERAEADKEKKIPFQQFTLEHRYHLRKQGGETGLSQEEWEDLTSPAILQSVVISQPDKKVGELLNKCTLYDRREFAKALVKEENHLKRYGERMVGDALQAARELKAAKNKAAKSAKIDSMEPEF